MNTKQIIGMFVGIAGLGLVWGFAGWQVALGVFLMLWGNNLEQRSARTVTGERNEPHR